MGEEKELKTVGQLARMTKLTVRALHHWDEIGLLSPAHRSASRAMAGYRLYSEADIARLQKIVSLRQVGFALEEIRACLEDRRYSLRRVLKMHLARLEKQASETIRLRDRMKAVVALLGSSRRIPPEDLLRLIQEVVMIERHYTPQQLEQLKERADRLGSEGMRKGQEDWAKLIANVKAEIKKGTAPDSEAGRRLAHCWGALIRQFTGGDAGIAKSLKTMYRKEPGACQQFGVDPAVSEFIAKTGVRII